MNHEWILDVNQLGDPQLVLQHWICTRCGSTTLLRSKPPPIYEYINSGDKRGIFKRPVTCDDVVLQKVMDS